MGLYLMREIEKRLEAEYSAQKALAVRALGQERYDNSPCQAHPLELVENELAALRARVAELEGDLNVARLQLGARVCSECPAKARVAELEARPVAWCSEDCRLNGCEAARANYFASMNAVRGSDKQCRASGNKGGSRDG